MYLGHVPVKVYECLPWIMGKTRRQHTKASSLLPPCGWWASSSCHQALWRKTLPGFCAGFFDNCILHALPSSTLWVWLQGWDNGLPVSMCLLTHRAHWSPIVSQIAEVYLFVSEQCPIEYAHHAFLVTN